MKDVQEKGTLNQYEAMFIFDPTFAAKYEKAEAEIKRLMERASAQDVVARRWEERRLAYRIAGRKRGVYVLVYFKASGDSIAGIERDAKLSENILRVLVVRADHVTREDLEWARALPAEPQEPAEPEPPDDLVTAPETVESQTAGTADYEGDAAAAVAADPEESVPGGDDVSEI